MRGGGDWRRGHEAGVDALRRTVEFCLDDGVRALTVFALSSENLAGRPAPEVSFLLGLLELAIGQELPNLQVRRLRD